MIDLASLTPATTTLRWPFSDKNSSLTWCSGICAVAPKVEWTSSRLSSMWPDHRIRQQRISAQRKEASSRYPTGRKDVSLMSEPTWYHHM
eukprot:312454-Amphidinium_carterae.1